MESAGRLEHRRQGGRVLVAPRHFADRPGDLGTCPRPRPRLGPRLGLGPWVWVTGAGPGPRLRLRLRRPLVCRWRWGGRCRRKPRRAWPRTVGLQPVRALPSGRVGRRLLVANGPAGQSGPQPRRSVPVRRRRAGIRDFGCVRVVGHEARWSLRDTRAASAADCGNAVCDRIACRSPRHHDPALELR